MKLQVSYLETKFSLFPLGTLSPWRPLPNSAPPLFPPPALSNPVLLARAFSSTHLLSIDDRLSPIHIGRCLLRRLLARARGSHRDLRSIID